MIVFGGSIQPPCPPNAGCAGPSRKQIMRDGASYDPVANSWQALRDAPGGVTYGSALWTGREMVVVAPSLTGIRRDTQRASTLAYDPARDRWRRLPAPPQRGWIAGGIRTGDQVLYWQSEEREGRHDWLLDPADGSWTRLPPDPFPDTHDRSYVWIGDRLLFTALLSSRVGSDAPSTYRVADYDLVKGRWRKRPPSPVGFWDPNWFHYKGYVVNPSQQVESDGREQSDRPSPGGVLNLRTGRWRPVAQANVSYRRFLTRCDLPRIGPAGPWLAGGGPVLVSVRPRAWSLAPRCPRLTRPDVGVWTGEEIVIWGGPARKYRINSNAGFAWRPPVPD